MNHTLSHEAHDQQKLGHRHNAKTQLRAGADAMLRDIAFVLKMTQKVRAEIDAGKESNELVMA